MSNPNTAEEIAEDGLELIEIARRLQGITNRLQEGQKLVEQSELYRIRSMLVNLGEALKDEEDFEELLSNKLRMQEHAAQTLDGLKEKIEINEAEISQGKSHSKAFMKGRISENNRILNLIEEVRDE